MTSYNPSPVGTAAYTVETKQTLGTGELNYRAGVGLWFSRLSVYIHLCEQHEGRDAARRAGSSGHCDKLAMVVGQTKLIIISCSIIHQLW